MRSRVPHMPLVRSERVAAWPRRSESREWRGASIWRQAAPQHPSHEGAGRSRRASRERRDRRRRTRPGIGLLGGIRAAAALGFPLAAYLATAVDAEADDGARIDIGLDRPVS